MRKIEKKGAMPLEELGWWLIALALLVLIVIAIIIFKVSGGNAIAYIKDMFRSVRV